MYTLETWGRHKQIEAHDAVSLHTICRASRIQSRSRVIDVLGHALENGRETHDAHVLGLIPDAAILGVIRGTGLALGCCLWRGTNCAEELLSADFDVVHRATTQLDVESAGDLLTNHTLGALLDDGWLVLRRCRSVCDSWSSCSVRLHSFLKLLKSWGILTAASCCKTVLQALVHEHATLCKDVDLHGMEWKVLFLHTLGECLEQSKLAFVILLLGESLLGALCRAWHCVHCALALLFVHKLQGFRLGLCLCSTARALVVDQALSIRVSEILCLVVLALYSLIQLQEVHRHDFVIVLECAILKASHFAIVAFAFWHIPQCGHAGKRQTENP